MAGTPTRLKVGDYVYTIYQNQLVGRLRITPSNPCGQPQVRKAAR